MNPAQFDLANGVLRAPEGLEGEVGDLPCRFYRDDFNRPVVLSCWELSPEEIAELQRTGRIWLHVWGRTMPPVGLTALAPEAQESDLPGSGT